MTLIFRTKNSSYKVGSQMAEDGKMEKRKMEVQFDIIIQKKKIRSLNIEFFAPEIPELELGFQRM